MNKTMLELGSSYEFDLILTDEDTSRNVCAIWMIHSQETKGLEVSHQEKLKPAEVN